MHHKRTLAAAALAALALPGLAAADEIPVGHIVDFTGATSGVGVSFGSGIADAMNWINANGGIDGDTLAFETYDYAYQAPRAVSTYRRWVAQDHIVAVQGWGTADTEALAEFVARDEIPYWSASYSGALTDPNGTGPRSTKAAPYNFFYGPSYSDGCRALVQWASEDWAARGEDGAPTFVHMGDNHPYPNAPKEACGEYAEELGFEVLPAINYTLAPGDFTPQCLTLKEIGADYAFLANTAGSGISLMTACATVGVETQFMTNVWGFDENAMRAAGEAADGTVFVVRTGTVWGDDAPGMETVRAISDASSRPGEYRLVHYITGICSAFYMKEAMEWAHENGGVTGPNIRQGMYAMSAANDGAWVPVGLEGVCLPSGWTAEDHRGLMTARIYRGHVNGSTEGQEIAELINSGTISLEFLEEITLERRPEWIGY
ncbi:MAG: ABC transporter substrate-binding protein [Rhodospirillaceae bacterium]|nr:ABC transporter substrate-binding protein [Rhodospirillaceae bacterium]